MTAAERLVAAARTYDGVRFRHYGRTTAGLDCVGLLLAAAADAGIQADDPGPYARGHRGWDMRDWLGARYDRVQPHTSHADGDVLLFTSPGTRLPCHVGLRTTRDAVPHVIHAQAERGRVMEEPIAFDLVRQHFATYRLREA